MDNHIHIVYAFCHYELQWTSCNKWWNGKKNSFSERLDQHGCYKSTQVIVLATYVHYQQER